MIKHEKILFILAKLIFGANSDYIRAIQYNDRIANYQDKIVKKMINRSKAFSKADPADMNTKLKVFKLKIDESLAKVSKMQDFKGNFRLRDAAIAIFKFYQSVAAKDYPEIINILSLGAQNISDENRDRIISIREDIADEELDFYAILHGAQKEFSELCGLCLKMDKCQDKIDKLEKTIAKQ